MNKRLASIVFFLFALIISSAFILWVWTDSSKTKKKAALDEYLKKCDVAISLENRALSKSLLSNIDRDIVLSADDWLRVLKRAYAFGRLSEDYDLLIKLGTEALYEFPGNMNIRLLLIEAYRQKGDVKRAFELARSYLSYYEGRPFVISLWKDMLRSYPHAFSIANVERFSRLLPFFSDPDVYLDIASGYGDLDMYIRAALMMLRSGEYKKALSVLSSLNDSLALSLMVYVLYDSGAYSEVIEHSESFLSVPSPERLLVVADSFMLSGQPLQAARLYQHVINIVPEYSYLPYHNLVYYYSSIGSYDLAEKVLDDALIKYGEDKNLVADNIRLLLETDRYEDAKAILKQYDNLAYPSLLSAVFLSQKMGQDAIRSRLWELMSLFPEDESVIKYSAWFFTQHRMWQDLDNLLDKSRALFFKKDWYALFSSVFFAVKEKKSQAIRILKDYDWSRSLYRDDALYNLALLLGLEKRYDEALKVIDRGVLPDKDSSVLSRFMVLRAWIYLCNQNEVAARNVLDKALALQPDNFDAIILLRKFEK